MTTEFILAAPREQQDRSGVIRMHPSGRYVRPFDFDPADFDIRDIAHHTSKLCRYTGAVPTDDIYSVAQHSLIVSDYFSDPQLRLAALLHDGAEAYMNDLSSPVKHQLPDYKAAITAIEQKMFARYGLPWELMAQVKPFDTLVFRREVASFWGQDFMQPGDRIVIKPIRQVRDAFLRRFHELRPDDKQVAA